MIDVALVGQLWEIINRAGVIGVLLLALVFTLVALDRGWVYTGRSVKALDDGWRSRFEDLKADRDAMRRERDDWKLIATTLRRADRTDRDV